MKTLIQKSNNWFYLGLAYFLLGALITLLVHSAMSFLMYVGFFFMVISVLFDGLDLLKKELLKELNKETPFG